MEYHQREQGPYEYNMYSILFSTNYYIIMTAAAAVRERVYMHNNSNNNISMYMRI